MMAGSKFENAIRSEVRSMAGPKSRALGDHASGQVLFQEPYGTIADQL